jgi:hypothetical protein
VSPGVANGRQFHWGAFKKGICSSTTNLWDKEDIQHTKNMLAN